MKSSSCLVLDLDSTLITTFGKDTDWEFVADHDNRQLIRKTYDIDVYDRVMWGTKRPYVKEFLTSAFESFDMVGVWSAGVCPYVREIVKEIFPRCPHFIWTRKDCVDHADLDSAEMVLQKPLSKLCKAYPQIDPKRVLIVDDYSSVCRQDTLQHVQIPEWKGEFRTLTQEDDSLQKLATWFDSTLLKSDDFKNVSHKDLFVDTFNAT